MLKQYKEQEKSRSQAKKELEEQLKFRSLSPVEIIIEDSKQISDQCVFETVVTSQEHVIQKAEVININTYFQNLDSWKQFLPN